MSNLDKEQSYKMDEEKIENRKQAIKLLETIKERDKNKKFRLEPIVKGYKFKEIK